MRTTLAISLLLTAIAASLDASRAEACKLGPAPPYDASAGSTDAPPRLEIASVAISLGAHYGGAGPGDCSDLGKVDLELTTADRALLDGKFGARVVVLAGELPVVLENLDTWVAPIRDNRIQLRIKGDQPSVDFSVAVQAVNAVGVQGPPSAPVHRSAEVGGGCQVGGGGRGSPAWTVVALLLFAPRFRRREPGAPAAPPAPGSAGTDR